MIRIGTDITPISRIEKSMQRFGDRFAARFLTAEEIASLSMKSSSVAGYWAAKESVAKALGCGIGADLSFHDMTISKDERGAPHLSLSPAKMKSFGISRISVSISHDGGFAIAVAAVDTKS